MKPRTADILINGAAWLLFIAFAAVMIVHHVETDAREARLKRALILHALEQRNTLHIYIEKGQP